MNFVPTRTRSKVQEPGRKKDAPKESDGSAETEENVREPS